MSAPTIRIETSTRTEREDAERQGLLPSMYAALRTTGATHRAVLTLVELGVSLPDYLFARQSGVSHETIVALHFAGRDIHAQAIA